MRSSTGVWVEPLAKSLIEIGILAWIKTFVLTFNIGIVPESGMEASLITCSSQRTRYEFAPVPYPRFDGVMWYVTADWSRMRRLHYIVTMNGTTNYGILAVNLDATLKSYREMKLESIG